VNIQRANRSARMAKGSRVEIAPGAKARRGTRDRGATGEPGIEIHLKEYGGTTTGIRPK